MKRYKERAITLVALVITIVILLILAGVGIQAITNNNLIQNASNAVEKYNEQSEKEKLVETLSGLIISKNSDPNYNENEYIDSQIEKDGMSIDGDDIVTVDKYKFKIDREKLQITEDLGKETLSDFEKLKNSYVQDSLVCWYDGIYNTKSGHDESTTTWEDLSEHGNNGTLNNINNTNDSGWTNNSLIFDGKNDWVAMKYLHYDYMTVEIVAKLITESKGNQLYLIDNYEHGGIGIDRLSSGYMQGMVNINGSYIKVKSSNAFKVNQKYSMTTRYDGANVLFRENDDKYITPKVGKITKPSSSTIFVLGANSYGSGYEERLNNNFEVYSVRIYNRALSDDEMAQNYNADRRRFEF